MFGYNLCFVFVFCGKYKKKMEEWRMRMGMRIGIEVLKVFEFGWVGVVEVFDVLLNGLLVGEFLVFGCKSDFGVEG